MYIVMGGTGHVGSAVAQSLLQRGAPVAIVTRDARAATIPHGASAIEADASDADSLRAAFRQGHRAFLLNPPAPPAADCDAEETQTADMIVAAIEGSGLKAVVAQSTYGAQPGRMIGDLGTLFHFEQALRAQSVPAAMVRAAYYMTNWDVQLDSACAGTLATMIPADQAIPMVDAVDLGEAIADLLMGDDVDGVHHVEGPTRYTPSDVAAAFARALGRPVTLDVIPRDRWEASFRELGFSATAACSYASMTTTTVDGGVELPTHPRRGVVTLQQHVDALVAT